MKKKITYIVASRTWGGGEEYLYRLGSAMKERGHEVAFAINAKANDTVKERFAEIGETILLKRKIRLFPFRTSFMLYRYTKSHQPSVIHVNAIGDYFMGAWTKIFSRGKVRIVATNHLVRSVKNSLFRRWIYSHIDAIIHVSECAKEAYFEKERVRECFRQVYVIRNSVSDIPCCEKSDASEVKVLYHGRIHPEKGILDIVSHWHKANVKLYIAGTGERVPEKKNVVCLGFQPDIREHLGEYDISLSPSIVRESGGPLSVIEAMAAGVAVVASDNGCQKEYIRDGVDGILCPAGDWESFVAAVNRLAADEELRRTMGRNGREHYEKELSFERFVDSVEAVYDNL